MHGAVCHVDEGKQLDGRLHTLGDVLGDGLKNVLYDGLVTEEGEGPLKHDGDAPDDLLPERVVDTEGPEIDRVHGGVATATLAGHALDGDSEVAAVAAPAEMIEDAA